MTLERIVTGGPLGEEEESFNRTLRPSLMKDYVGQRDVVEKLSISIRAAKERNEPLEHVLFYGPPGLGKTTLAYIISNEMGTRLTTSSGPALVRPGDLMGILTNLEEGDVLFIDEIHRLSTAVEEFIYRPIEDFHVDFVVDKGAFAKTLSVPLKRFTLIGATTRAGFLSAPLRERFGLFHHLDFYPPEDLEVIIKRSAKLLNVPIEDQAAAITAKRSRGTPRIANRLLRRVRDYAQVKGDGSISTDISKAALELEGIDEMGLDELDRKFLKVIMEYYDGGPVGIETLAATLNEESDTLEEVVEPYLLKIGFLNRTSKGRVASTRAWKHMGFEKKRAQGDLFGAGGSE